MSTGGRGLRHPWHPVFVHFPISCWVIGFAGELLYYLLPELALPGGTAPGAFVVLMLWLGNLTAVAAMIAGLVDMTALPEKPAVMSVVYKHMALMLCAWALMLGAGTIRLLGEGWTLPAGLPVLGLELLAVACLIVGGLQASHLVYRLHLGEVD